VKVTMSIGKVNRPTSGTAQKQPTRGSAVLLIPYGPRDCLMQISPDWLRPPHRPRGTVQPGDPTIRKATGWNRSLPLWSLRLPGILTGGASITTSFRASNLE
jgi:hypothetical protein